jgi:hypothetical protein
MKFAARFCETSCPDATYNVERVSPTRFIAFDYLRMGSSPSPLIGIYKCFLKFDFEFEEIFEFT